MLWLLGLAVTGVCPATTAELSKLQAIRVVPPVLERRVVAFLAVGTLQSDDRGAALRRCHVFASTQKINLAALGQVRLYQRPREAVHRSVGTIARRGPK
jgi:hypothetical protein